jgi:sucrose synthase
MCSANDENALEIDFGAMDFSTPRMALSSSIGNGVGFISRFMTSRLHGSCDGAKPLLDYLQALNHHGEVQTWFKSKPRNGRSNYLEKIVARNLMTIIHVAPILQSLMINGTVNTVSMLQNALVAAEEYVSRFPKDTPFQNFEQRSPLFSMFKKQKKMFSHKFHRYWIVHPSILYYFSGRFKEWGFEKGWGSTAERVKETIRILSEALQAPDPEKLELLFSRLPTNFNIVIFSPHGYFGQSDVLGLPDTGGQVYNASKHHYSITNNNDNMTNHHGKTLYNY